MDQFRIAVSKDGNLFAAAHFITYADGEAERLHGHNYRTGATVWGPLDEYHLVFDFVRLQRELASVAAQLDHRVLLAAHNPALRLDHSVAGHVGVRHGDRQYLFPEDDVLVLDIANTTAELLASWIADRLLESLGPAAAPLTRIDVEVEETTGQSAFARRDLDG